MFEPLTQTVTQLATRWNCSVSDVLTHANEYNWPLYFQFEGLVFDFNDRSNRSGGNSKQVEAANQLMAEIEGAEATLRRNALSLQGALKLTEWEGSLTDAGMDELRHETKIKKTMLEILIRSMGAWNQQRQRFQRNGALRAAPATLQGVAERGSVPFPIRAYHPESPTLLVREPGGRSQYFEGRLVVLEDMRHPKDVLTADDLFANMADVRAIDAVAPTIDVPSANVHLPTHAGHSTEVDANKWDRYALQRLLNESVDPDMTQAKLGERYGVSRQRIGELLKQAKEKAAPKKAGPFDGVVKSNRPK